MKVKNNNGNIVRLAAAQALSMTTMNVNIIKENIDIKIDKYPYSKSINKTLMDDIDTVSYTHLTLPTTPYV